MAKYDLQPIQSMYRDTGAVQINQLKRQEYLANMQADNALATSVMNMEALDKDRDKLENLAELYTSKIDQRAQRKDYENLGMSIAQDAMDFTKDYTPIKRQVDIRAGYKASLDEAVKAKRIDQSTANNLLAESDYNYKGVETSPSGIVDRDSFYQGSSFVGNINVNELMQEEYVIQNAHNVKMEKIKDAERYYEQAMLGTMNLSLGIILVSSLVIRNLLS